MARGKHISIVSLALIFLATGCIVRTYTVVKDRPDLELTEGNQGYLQGAPSQPPVVEKTTRTTYVTEIELGEPYEEQLVVEQYNKEKAAKKAAKQKKVPEGYYTNETISNAAAKIKEKGVSEGDNLSATKVKKEEPLVVFGKQDIKPATTVSTQKLTKINTYIVKDGDTLEKIAARPEVYGDKKKWYKIYKANQDQLKEPNKILPGQVLKIPE